MITLYYWEPTTPAAVIEHGIMPDLGHASLEISGNTDVPDLYASFWPESESLIGTVTDLFKKRQVRFPDSYAEECDPQGCFMQRPADAVEHISGLDEVRIARLWRLMQGQEYDFRHWNCSNVCRFLLTAAMSREQYDCAASVAECTWEALLEAASEGASELAGTLRILATSSWLDCRPDDVLRMARSLRLTDDAISPRPTP